LEGNVFRWTPSYLQAGNHIVTFIVSDGSLTDSEPITITVNNINRLPEVRNRIENQVFSEDCGEQSIADLNEVFFDPDGDELDYSVTGEAWLNLNIDENAILTINPEADYFGETEIILTASDGDRAMQFGRRDALRSVNYEQQRALSTLLADNYLRMFNNPAEFPARDAVNLTFIITIEPVNDAPRWSRYPDSPILVDAGEAIDFIVAAIDVDSDQLRLTCDLRELPESVEFHDNGDGSGRFYWQTERLDVFDRIVHFNISDGEFDIGLDIRIIVCSALRNYDFVITNSNHSILVTGVTFEGEPVPTGWEIAVFTSGNFCAGGMMWFDDGEPHGFAAYGDDPETQAADGFRNGEMMRFRLWDNEADIEYSAAANIADGPAVWTADALTILMLTGAGGRNCDVALNLGWNLISINVRPPQELWRRQEGPDIIRMTEQLRYNPDNPRSPHHIVLLKDERGRFYTPQLGFCNIPYWELTEAYQVKMDAAMQTSWFGQPIAADADVPIALGWNMIAYFPDYELSAAGPQLYVISPIRNDVIIAKNAAGRFMIPALGFSNMPPWRSGQGYQIKVSRNLVFNYPAPRGLLGQASSQVESVEQWSEPLNTGSNMSVLTIFLDGQLIENSSRVAAFSAAGTLVGVGTITDGVAGLAVWGDDPTTDEIDGLLNGEQFSLKVWIKSSNEVIPLSARSFKAGRSLTYETDSFVAVEAVLIPLDYYFGSNYPNPFNSSATLTYGLSQRTRVSIYMNDVSGRMVARLVDGVQEAGHYQVRYNLPELSAGVYLVRMEAGNFRVVRKVTLLK